jgi:predicted ATPase/class 3 adenylate cyclase
VIDIPTDSVTFLFTDIEGSTQLWEQHPEAMKAALARHDAILRAAIENHHGRVFKTVGDAFYAAFSKAPEALAAALAAQRALHAEVGQAVEDGPIIRVRMALHTGAADERDGDYFGPSLNRVARLLAIGYGGQTLLSAVTDELVRAHLPSDVTLRDMGEWRLKDLTRLEHIYQLIVPDLPADFPPLKALETLRTNLPAQLTSFVGREKEIAAVKQLIATSRLTTLTGPGGTGKTRLSLRVASDLLDSFTNGVWFVELAPLADPALIPQTVATALGLREETGRPLLDTLTDFLRAKTALLILDNCEHLVEASAQLAEALLQACPNLRMLVSSREALGIPGETPYRVPSLSIPDAHHAQSVETVMQYEAARLFMDRAKTALPSFEITNENAPAVAQVCSRLDGIPLAIELAAARVKMLKVEQIAERLDDRFRLLTGGSRTALPRQQTLRALIDWSYDLLPEPERVLLRRLSVFAGGWTLEAAEQVCKDEVRSQKDEGGSKGGVLHPSSFIIHPFDVLDLLTQLVNKSLVVVDVEGGTETRYRLLETVRQYAREKLAESGEGMVIRDHHLEYFLDLAERAEPQLIGPHESEWLKRLDNELDNLRVALEWSLKQDVQVGLRLASALWLYWNGGLNIEGSDWLSQLLQQPTASVRNAMRARALTILGNLSMTQFDDARLEPLIREGLEIYRALGDQRGIAFALLIVGQRLCLQDDYNAGRPLVFESLALYRTLGDIPGIALVLGMLGLVVDNKDYARARAYLEESLGLYRALGSSIGIARILSLLSRLAYRSGDFAIARTWLTEAIDIYHSLGRADVHFIVESLGELAWREGDYESARTYLEEDVSLANKSGQILDSYFSLAHLGYIALRQGDLARAHSLLIETLQGFKEAGRKIGVVYTLEGLASLGVAQSQPQRAACIFAWADATRETIGDPRPPVEQADVDQDLAKIHTQLDEAAFAAAQSAGRAMNMDQAIALALESTHE